MPSVVPNVTVFLYNFGVLLSGAYGVVLFGIEERRPVIALMFIFAVFWTLYFRLGMYPRLVARPEADDD